MVLFTASAVLVSNFSSAILSAGDRINSVNVIPSIDGNASYELLVGTKNGTVVCYSGGLNAVPVELVSFTPSAEA